MTNDCPGGSVQRFIRVAKQTSLDVEGTTFRYLSLPQNADDSIVTENVESRGLENVNATQNDLGTRTSTTSADFDYQVGRVFELGFGTPTHAETTTDWVHTFNVETVPPYLTVIVGSDAGGGIKATKHKNHLVDSMVLTYEVNGNVQVNVSTLGRFVEGVTVKPGVGDGYTVPSTPVLSYRNAKFEINTTAVKRVQSGSITFAGDVQTIAGSESVDVDCTVFLGRSVEFSINAAMNTNLFREHIKNEDITIVSLVVDNEVALGSGKRGFECDLGSIVVTGLEETGSVGAITTFTISGSAVVTRLVATDGISDVNW